MDVISLMLMVLLPFANVFLETIKAGYFIKCAVVTDSDSNRSKKIAERASNLSKRYSSEKIIIECTSENLSTFEKKYRRKQN